MTRQGAGVGRRITVWTVAFGLALMVVSFAIDYRAAVRKTEQELNDALARLRFIRMQELDHYLANQHEERLMLPLQGLVAQRVFSAARLQRPGRPDVGLGRPAADARCYRFALDGGAVLSVWTDEQYLQSRASERVRDKLLNDLAWLLLVTGISALLVHLLLLRPLRRLTLDIAADRVPAVGTRGDELDVLAGTYAELRRTLRTQLEQQKQEFELSLDLLIVAGLDGSIWQVNRAWHATLGYDPQSLPGKRFLEFVHPDDIAPTRQAMAALMRDEPVRQFVNRYRHRDGAWRSISWNAQTLTEPRRIFAVGRDITAREEQLRALRESEERYRRLVDALPHIVYIYHPRRGGLYYSAAVREVFGLTPQQMLAQPTRWADSIHPDDAPRVHEAVERFWQGGCFDLEYRVRDAHGQWRWLRDRSIGRLHDGDTVLIEGMATDVTARKMSEALLREEQRFLHRVLDGMMPYATLLERDGTVLAVNRAPLEAAGLTEIDVVGRKFWDCPWWNYDAAVSARLRDMVRAAAAGEEQRADMVARMARDAFQTVDFSLRPLRDEQEGISHLIASATDITERRAAEDALRRSEERLQTLLRHSSDAIIVSDAQMRANFVSASMTRITGYPVERFLGSLRGMEYHHPEDQPGIAAAFAEALADPGKPKMVRYRLRHADGHWLHLEAVLCNLLDDPAVRGVLVNVRDISMQHQAQQAMLHTEKLASLGRLAAGIAHEMNQPLNAIRNYCQGLLLNIEDGIPTPEEKVRGNLAAAVQQVDRMADIIRNLRVFTHRDGEGARERVPLARVIRYPLALLGAQFRSHNIALDVSPALQDDSACILGNENRLQQVFINLFVHARDSILARRVQEADWRGEYRISLAVDGGKATVSLVDNGRPIASEDLPHIFEPFYAGRDVVQGVGLGLAVCHEIVRQHDGNLTVSADSSGNTFTLTFPLA